MFFLKRLLRLFSRDIAMDLGTANTLLYTRRGGIVVNEPSVVELDAETGDVLAVGARARLARGRTPGGISCVRPLRSGVIADFDVTMKMIVHFIREAIGSSRWLRPSMVICVPTGITEVEKKAVVDAAFQAGAVKVSLVEEPMAAAVGAGLPIESPQGSLVADIGGGTTEVAVITLSAIAVSQSVRIAGDAMNEAIQEALRTEHRLEVGENTAERIKLEIGSAWPVPGLEPIEVAGKDIALGRPSRLMVSPDFVREVLRGPVDLIAQTVLRTLERTPAALAADIYDSGLVLTGGGALLRGLDAYLSDRIELPVHIDSDPLTTVLRGTSMAMTEPRRYEDVFLN